MGGIDYLKVIENDYELEFYKNLHQQILTYLSIKKKSTFYELLLACGGSDRRVLRLLDQMVNNGEILIKNSMIKCINFVKLSDYTAKMFSKLTTYRKILKSIKFTPTFIFDQRPINYTSKVMRLKKLLSDNQLYNAKNIIFLGDDDLVSLLTAIVLTDKKIYVLDIDPRLEAIFKKLILKYQIQNLFFIKYDASNPIPKELKKRFDFLVMDPSPTPSSFEMFIKTAKNLLKYRGVGYLSFYPSHTQITIDFQRILTKYNFIVTEMIPYYTKYSFIKSTYSNNDINLLKKYKIRTRSLINFHENITKVILLNKNDTINKNIIPKATSRVFKDIKKDPSYKMIIKNKELYAYYKKHTPQ